LTILNDKNNILFIKQQNVSLYLKYRPSDFSSLYGQNFTKQTLQKAIAEDKTVGAYLFCGPRGTGKTSSARIFAKAINCLDPQE
jgi:DNA polymerase-3 subunit gamma/tau